MGNITALLSATALMLALIILRPFLKKYVSPRAVCALWLIPAVRLIFPFELKSTFSILAPAEKISQSAQQAASLPANIEAPSWLGSYIGIGAQPPSAAVESGVSSGAAQTASVSFGDIALYIWLVGFAVTATIIIYKNIVFFRRLKRLAQPVLGGFKLPVYLVSSLPSPCLAGIFKPVIYINECAAASDNILQMTLRHELTHYRRKDHIWCAVRNVMTAVYWFHPLVWVCSELFRRDCETACDESATRKMTSEQRESYGMALISLASHQSARSTDTVMCLSTMSSGKKLLKERISLLASGKRLKSAAVIAAAVAVILCCTMCTVPNDTASDDSDENVSGQQNIIPNSAPSPSQPDEEEPGDYPRQSDYGSMEDMAYYLEFSVPGVEFTDMSEAHMQALLEEYGELLAGYEFIARESIDKSCAYIIGEYSGDASESPLYMMESFEYDGTDQVIHSMEQNEAVNAAFPDLSSISDIAHVISESRADYSMYDPKLIFIQPENIDTYLHTARYRYMSAAAGPAYIVDAVSRGISVNDCDAPHLTVYLISEKYGEISENIPLTESEAAAIQDEELVKLSDHGFGFSASLYTGDDSVYYSEYGGVPQSVIDLAVEKCGVKFETPADIGTITDARLECSWLTAPCIPDSADLARLEEILKNAEYSFVGKCGYGAKLVLTFEDGRTMTVFKGSDSCGTLVFGSYGGYEINDSENTEFWTIFGLDPDEKLPVAKE